VRGYDALTYGEATAEAFDRMVEAVGMPSPDAAVERLAELAGDGRALELGPATGRVAIPLAARGVPVHAIEISPAMAERLAAKDGGSAVQVTLGNFEDVDVEETFRLVFAVAHTFFSLVTQDAQVRCFQNVARRLDPEGVFVLEAWVPDPAQIGRGALVGPVATAADELVLVVKSYDAHNQLLEGHHVEFRNGDVTLYPEVVRYAWPTELDLMARLAGMRLRSRWADWSGKPFDRGSRVHVSIYELDR
jgi:SAM-dependent methyltransferase